jgi:uncharacterized protein YdaU (DUF1376 family)
MHYYQFHIGDYISHTIHLSPEEDLAYRRLLDMYYDTEQPIPNNIPLVSRRLRLGSDVVQSVLDEFFVASEDGYKNHRADLEIREYHAFIDKQRSNGKLGGRPKKTQRKPTANPNQSQNNPNQQPLTTNHKPKKEIATVVATPVGVSESVWQDFVKQRKAKKAAVTQTVIDGIQREANKADWTLDAALSECVVRGWQSFKADWVAPKQTFAQQAADVARTTVPAANSGPDPVLIKIEQDRKKAAPMPEHIRQQINSVLRKV